MISPTSADSKEYVALSLTLVKPASKADCHAKKASKAYYKMWMNPVAKTIIITDMMAPEKMRGATPPFPDLRRSSDLIWLAWVYECKRAGANPRNLQYVLRHWIANGETLTVATEVLERLGKKRERWPGVEVRVDGASEGDALVGCPNGRGVGWLCIDHRVGGRINKRPGSVVIFDSPGIGWLCLLYKLVDIH